MLQCYLDNCERQTSEKSARNHTFVSVFLRFLSKILYKLLKNRKCQILNVQNKNKRYLKKSAKRSTVYVIISPRNKILKPLLDIIYIQILKRLDKKM